MTAEQLGVCRGVAAVVDEGNMPLGRGTDIERSAVRTREHGHLAGPVDADQVVSAPTDRAPLDGHRAGHLACRHRRTGSPAVRVDRDHARPGLPRVVHLAEGGERGCVRSCVAGRVEVGERRREGEFHHLAGGGVDDGGEGATLHQIRFIGERPRCVHSSNVIGVHDTLVADPCICRHSGLSKCRSRPPFIGFARFRGEDLKAMRGSGRGERPVLRRHPVRAELLARVRNPGGWHRAIGLCGLSCLFGLFGLFGRRIRPGISQRGHGLYDCGENRRGRKHCDRGAGPSGHLHG